jgi:hypothetical protein
MDRVWTSGFGMPPQDYMKFNKRINEGDQVLELWSSTWRVWIEILTGTQKVHYHGIECENKFTIAFLQKIKKYRKVITNKWRIYNSLFLDYTTSKKFDVIILPFSIIAEIWPISMVLWKCIKLLRNWGRIIIDDHDHRYPITTLDSEIFKLNVFSIKKDLKIFKKLLYCISDTRYSVKWWFARRMYVIKKI